MFRLSIVTPEKIFFDGEVRSLVVPGADGYLGVLTSHAPLITSLTAGKIAFIDANGSDRFMAVSEGFFEVSNNVATVLADLIENSAEIDIDAARGALKEERNQLNSTAFDEEEVRLAIQRRIRWQQARIKVYEDTH